MEEVHPGVSRAQKPLRGGLPPSAVTASKGYAEWLAVNLCPPLLSLLAKGLGKELVKE